MKGWMITHDGKTAWRWENPHHRVELTDADSFVKEVTAKGEKVLSDDRFEPGRNVWD